MKYLLHVDMNSFFASCHIAQDPKLRGKPVVVSGTSRRSVILTASYEARKFGINSAMPMYLAYRKCDHLIVVEPDYDLYKKYSEYFFNYIKRYCDVYSAGSIDEAYMDITETHKKYGGVMKLAKKIQDELMEKYYLPCSIGVSYTKFLAKMGSDIKKPLGITVIGPDDLEEKLYSLNIKETFGIGKMTVPKLNNIGIYKIGDFITFERQDILKKVLKNSYDDILLKITGKSSDLVEKSNYSDLKQIGNSSTFQKDIFEEREILKKILYLAEKVHKRMKNRKVVSKTFSISIRYSDFKTINRSMTLSQETDEISVMHEIATSLFESHWNGTEVRHVGFSTGAIINKSSTYKQLDLFNYQDEVVSDLDNVIKGLNNRYKKEIIFKSSKK